jgi:hypothetical protein
VRWRTTKKQEHDKNNLKSIDGSKEKMNEKISE